MENNNSEQGEYITHVRIYDMSDLYIYLWTLQLPTLTSDLWTRKLNIESDSVLL